MSEEFPSEAFGVPIEVSDDGAQNEDFPEGSDDNSAMSFYDQNFLQFNQLKDSKGQPLITNQTYCLVRGDTSWDVLEQGSNPRQVKFTNYGRHFNIYPSNGHNDSKCCVLKAINLGKYVGGFHMSGNDVTYGDSLASAWYFDTERIDSKEHRCYRIYTRMGTVAGGGGGMPGVPMYSASRVGLDKDNEWSSGASTKVNFDVKFIPK